MQNSVLRTFLIAGIVFLALLAVVNILFALLLGGLPNGVQLQATSNLAFLQVLWQDNPWETVKLVLIDKPLVVIEQLHHETGLQVWGMFYYVGTVLVYLLVSAFTALHWSALMNSSAKQRVLFTAGVVTVLIGVTCLRLAACCTSSPGWVLDAWLLTKVYTPNLGAVNWILVYESTKPWLPMLQTGVLVGGMAMLYRWRLSARSPAV